MMKQGIRPRLAVRTGAALAVVAGLALGGVVATVPFLSENTVQQAYAASSSQEGATTAIKLAQDASTVDGDGAVVEGNTVTITTGGTYTLSGTLEDGQVCVDAEDEKVTLVLNGVDITSDGDNAISVQNAKKVTVQLADDSENRLQSGETVEIAAENLDENASGAALYAKCDLTIEGDGTLTIEGYINNGIHTTKDLVIDGGTLDITAINNGIKGKNSVTVTSGDISIVSANDGIKSDNEDDEDKGWIEISGGTFSINSLGDAIQAETALTITDGEFDIVTGTGSADAGQQGSDMFGNMSGFGGMSWDFSDDTDESIKGIKCGTDLVIEGGTFTIDAEDDAIHSNSTVAISGGTFELATGDDGIHADVSLTIDEADIAITASYEGLEANQITIDGGTIDLTASDDGLNANGGTGMGMMMGGFGGFGGGDGSSATSSTPNLIINGGTITINADGDGLDSNGNLLVTGGTVIVSGPTNSADGALDADGTRTITGGTVLALGASGMAQSFGTASTQCSFIYTFSSNFKEGDLITVEDANGTLLFEYTAIKSGNSVVFSSPDLVEGETYTLAAGDQSAEVTLSSVSTSNGGGMGGMGDMGMGGGQGGMMGGGMGQMDMGGQGGMGQMNTGGQMPDQGGQGNQGNGQQGGIGGQQQDGQAAGEANNGNPADTSDASAAADSAPSDLPSDMSGMPAQQSTDATASNAGQAPSDMGGQQQGNQAPNGGTSSK